MKKLMDLSVSGNEKTSERLWRLAMKRIRGFRLRNRRILTKKREAFFRSC